MAFYLAMTPFNMWSAREHTSQSMQTPSAWGLGAHASAHESRTVQRRASQAAYRMRFYSPSSRRHRRRFDTGARGCGKLQLSFTYCAGDSLQYLRDYGAPLRPAVSCGTVQWPPASEFRCTRPSWSEEGGRIDESQGFQGGVSGRPRLWRASGQPASSVGSNLNCRSSASLLSAASPQAANPLEDRTLFISANSCHVCACIQGPVRNSRRTSFSGRCYTGYDQDCLS